MCFTEKHREIAIVKLSIPKPSSPSMLIISDFSNTQSLLICGKKSDILSTDQDPGSRIESFANLKTHCNYNDCAVVGPLHFYLKVDYI